MTGRKISSFKDKHIQIDKKNTKILSIAEKS